MIRRRVFFWLGITSFALVILLHMIESLTIDRSTLYLHTDELTGCQYLSVQGGGLTPRLDSEGRQLCGGRL